MNNRVDYLFQFKLKCGENKTRKKDEKKKDDKSINCFYDTIAVIQITRWLKLNKKLKNH